MFYSFLRRAAPLLGRITCRLPGWAYWQLLWHANQKFLIGAAAVILDDEGQVLLFRHNFRPATFEWGLPSGWMKRGESVEQGLEREVYEESRLRVRILGPLSVHLAHSVPRLDLVFVGCPQGGSFQPSHEVTEAQFFPVDALPKMIPEQKNAILSAVRQRQFQSHFNEQEDYDDPDQAAQPR
jgi:8-oxo-dGTP diphosphatase